MSNWRERIGARSNRSPADSAAWITGIAMLAFASPTASALAPNVLFFTAHGTTAVAGLVMVLAAAMLMWLVWWLVLEIAARAGARAFDRITTIATALVASLGAWSILGQLAPRLLPVVALPIGVLLGSGIALLARRITIGRPLALVATITAAFPLAVAALPTSPAVAAQTATFTGSATAQHPDVIWVVADELQYPLVMRPDGTVREEFPNLRALQEQATTYARAYTPANYTDYAIPALLNGVSDISAMTSGEITAMKGSMGILSALSQEYAVVLESPLFTFTCSSADCRNAAPVEGESALQTAWTLIADTAAVVGRTSLAEPLASAFPSLDGKWRDFWSGGDSDGGRRIVIPAQRVIDRVSTVEQTDPQAPVLAMWHTMRSHAPWTVDGEGRSITPHRLPIVEGAHLVGSDDKGHFHTNELADLGYRMYADSARDFDRELGVLIDALKAQGRFDDALVVVAADHGVTINRVRDRRAGDTDTQLWSEAAHVPLIVKQPGQTQPSIIMEPRSTGQIARTILEGIGAQAAGTTTAPALDENPESIVFAHVGVAPMRTYPYTGISEVDPWTPKRLASLAPEASAPGRTSLDAQITVLDGESPVAIAVVDADFGRCASRVMSVTSNAASWRGWIDDEKTRAWAVMPRESAATLTATC